MQYLETIPNKLRIYKETTLSDQTKFHLDQV